MIGEELRCGDGDTLFLICGAGGAAAELAGLAQALGGSPHVVALVPRPAGGGAPDAAATVEAMASEAAALIRAHRPHGPYRLLGYSFGGIVALETGRLLRRDGEAVAFLGIVDAFFDRRHWPAGLFLRASARRAVVHARGLRGRAPGEAMREVRERLARLARRLRGRFGAPDEPAPASLTIEQANLLAMARWRPRVFTGETVLFTAAATDFGCDLATLWAPWLPELQVRRVPGSHLELVQEQDGIDRLAAAVDAALAAAAAPRLRTLVATTFRWPSAARLAAELHACGCTVDAVAPRGSALHDIAAVDRSWTLGLVDPTRSLRRAIDASAADLIIPFDDRTRRALHRVHADADPATDAGARLRERIERSLGPAEHYPDLYSRVAMLEIAEQSGIRCPPTAPVASAADITRWLALHPGPAVLKTDGSWGGRETRVLHAATDVPKAWRQLSRPPNIARCVKRALVERDPWPLRTRLTGTRPRLSVQSFVEGDPGNAAVACLDGELLGAVQAAVIRSNGPTGASTLVQVVEHREMLDAARTMVRRLHLTGLVGLDFILEHGTGHAHLIEINPRATPTSHLTSAEGVDVLSALRSGLGHSGPPRPAERYPGGRVALFPQEIERDPTGRLLQDAHHDVPWHAPDLVGHALAGISSPVCDDVRAHLSRAADRAGGDGGASGPPGVPGHADEHGSAPDATAPAAPSALAAPSSAPG